MQEERNVQSFFFNKSCTLIQELKKTLIFHHLPLLINPFRVAHSAHRFMPLVGSLVALSRLGSMKRDFHDSQNSKENDSIKTIYLPFEREFETQ